jgi:hypothetical protein
MITIKQYPPEIEITTTGSDSGSCLLLEPSQRQLLAWFAKEKPAMVREAMKEPITEDNWDPAVHGYCGDLERANARIKKAIETIEMQIGCSNMLYDDDEGGYEGEAYRQLRAECAKAIVLLKGEGGCK